ncbi:MAG: hypothetical protein OQJ81_09400 [Melioribacteraceae bacterium]|nr:hypothetical protein [Melioribacteraceae bacterium]
MTNDNVQKCSNCGEDNLLYEKNCKKCKHYLRAAVVNIDLWKTIWLLFENPKKAVKNLIMAEHKNFSIFLLFFLGLKLFTTSVIIQSSVNLTLPITEYFSANIIIGTLIYVALVLLYTFIFSKLLKRRAKVRFKDNFTIIVYSFIPIVFSLFILSPVEYGLFGKHWFLYNPSPFLIKSTLAYIILGLELLMLGWSLFILFIALKIQSNSSILGFIASFLFITIMIYSFFNIPFIIL